MGRRYTGSRGEGGRGANEIVGKVGGKGGGRRTLSKHSYSFTNIVVLGPRMGLQEGRGGGGMRSGSVDRRMVE